MNGLKTTARSVVRPVVSSVVVAESSGGGGIDLGSIAQPEAQSNLLRSGFFVTSDTNLIGTAIGNKAWVAHDLNAVNTPNILASSNSIDGNSSGTGSFLVDATDIGNDQRVSARISGTTMGTMLLARFSKTAMNGYGARYLTSTGAYQIGKFVAGSYTILVSGNATQPTDGSQFVFTLVGSTLTLFVNGLQVVTVSDATFATGAYVGVRLSATANTLTDFYAVPALTTTSDNVGNLTGDWERSGTTWAQSQRTGSSVRFTHTGEYLGLMVSNPSGITGYFGLTVDGGETFERFDLYAGTYLQPIFFSAGSSATRTGEIVMLGNSSTADNWTTPTNAFRITSLETKSGDSLSASAVASNQLVVIGDSISRGRAITDHDYSTGMGGRAWPYLLGRLLDADTDVIAFSGQGFITSGVGNVAAAPTATPLYRNGVSRSARTDVTHVIIAHGTNDGGSGGAPFRAAAISTWTAARTLYANARIYILLPFGYSANTGSPSALAYRDDYNGHLQTAFATWADGNSEVIDLTARAYGNSMLGPLNGGSNSYTDDLIHPNAATNVLMANHIFSVI